MYFFLLLKLKEDIVVVAIIPTIFRTTNSTNFPSKKVNMQASNMYKKIHDRKYLGN